MYANLKDLLPVLLALLSAWCLCQISASTCNNYQGTPHPSGFCGARLSRLHRNVCRYMRVVHPEFFNGSSSATAATSNKRSLLTHAPSPSSSGSLRGERSFVGRRGRHEQDSLEQLIYEVADRLVRERGLDLDHFLNDYWPEEDEAISDEGWHQKRRFQGMGSERARRGDEDGDFGKRSQSISTDKSLFGKMIRRSAESIAVRNKRGTGEHSGSLLGRRKRDLVCDCCYNACTFSTVALYC